MAYVINPATGRYIRVGGTTYNGLKAKGVHFGHSISRKRNMSTSRKRKASTSVKGRKTSLPIGKEKRVLLLKLKPNTDTMHLTVKENKK